MPSSSMSTRRGCVCICPAARSSWRDSSSQLSSPTSAAHDSSDSDCIRRARVASGYARRIPSSCTPPPGWSSRSRYAGSAYSFHTVSGSTTWPSASIIPDESYRRHREPPVRQTTDPSESACRFGREHRFGEPRTVIGAHDLVLVRADDRHRGPRGPARCTPARGGVAGDVDDGIGDHVAGAVDGGRERDQRLVPASGFRRRRTPRRA